MSQSWPADNALKDRNRLVYWRNVDMVEDVLDYLTVHKIPTKFALGNELPLLTWIASTSVKAMLICLVLLLVVAAFASIHNNP